MRLPRCAPAGETIGCCNAIAGAALVGVREADWVPTEERDEVDNSFAWKTECEGLTAR